MAKSSRFLFALVVSAALACGGTATPGDGGPPPSCDPIDPFATGDPNGSSDPLNVPAGQARAGRLTTSQLPEDRTALATWEEGDFVLANERIALIVEDVDESDLYDPYGGRPVGVARVSGGQLVEAADFNEIIFGFGSFLVHTEAVTVMNDGSDGSAAVVRASGPLHTLEFAGELLTGLLPGDFGGMPAALDYRLEPGSDAIEVTLNVTDPTPVFARTPALAAFFQAYRMPMWLETSTGSGFLHPEAEALPMVGFVDDGATSYAWLPPEGSPGMTRLVDQSGVLVFSVGTAIVDGCSTAAIPLGTMLVGGPGLPGLQDALARHRGETLRTISGTVTEADGSTPATDVRIHVRRADGDHFARVAPDGAGNFSLSVPNETVSVIAHRSGTAAGGPVDVPVEQNSVNVRMPAFGMLVVSASDADSRREAIPARVQVIPSAGAPVVPEDLGELRLSGGRAHVAFTTTGSVSLRVDPGDHEVIVSRGYEWEIVREMVHVDADESVNVDARLAHVVDTTGIMCADYHIHTHRSPDSPDSPRLKLESLIADGLEIPLRSDHEWINDFQPVIESLGLTQFAFGVSSEELTTFAWGHFGVFPVYEDRTRPNGSAVPWVGHLPPEVFDAVRARPENPALIINHPRSFTIAGYFEAAAFDPTTATAALPEMWDEGFGLVEVFNDSDFEQNREGTVRDWFALLNSGRRVFAVGSSDSHNVYGSPVGYPRTCLALGTDDPTALNANMIRDVTSDGHSTISGGIYLSVVGPSGAGPGDTATGVGATASFDVTVQAPCWIRATRLEVIVDGVPQEPTIDIPVTDPSECMPVRLSATGLTGISVPVAAGGSWVVFHASGDMDLTPVHPGRMPFAVSNPVFLRR